MGVQPRWAPQGSRPYQDDLHLETIYLYKEFDSVEQKNEAVREYHIDNLQMKSVEYKLDTLRRNIMTTYDQEFIAEIYELAFGEDAINKDFSHGEVIEKLKEFSDHAYKWEEQEGIL